MSSKQSTEKSPETVKRKVGVSHGIMLSELPESETKEMLGNEENDTENQGCLEVLRESEEETYGDVVDRESLE